MVWNFYYCHKSETDPASKKSISKLSENKDYYYSSSAADFGRSNESNVLISATNVTAIFSIATITKTNDDVITITTSEYPCEKLSRSNRKTTFKPMMKQK